jgi:hypothetical protein
MEETPSADSRAHGRQALLSLLFGLAAWFSAVAAMLLIISSANNGLRTNMAGVVFGVLFLMFSPLPALCGLGQATAAIRVRGNHMILATIGLLLSGLEVGIVIGMVSSLVVYMSSN